MRPYPHFAQRVFNTPLGLHPDKAEVILAALGERVGIAQVIRVDGRPLGAFDEQFAEEGETPEAGRYDNVEGIAVIQVQGTLVQRLGTMRPFSGMTGYDGLREAFIGALIDPEVEAIALEIDSPGGEIAGCFDLVDTIYRARGIKPVWAILSENAYSAAYAIASAADVVTVPRTGGTGSVGVIYLHMSYERLLDEMGVEVTLITKGDLKGEGNEFKNLSASAFRRLRADVMSVGTLFDATVARNRSLKRSAVVDTQAATFLGGEGVQVGFADAVLAPDAAFRALLDEIA
jgi:ClpP class serine protease